MKTDFHMHSCYSHDSQATVEEMTKAAIDKRVNAICFTEHIDYGVPADNDFDHAGLKHGVDILNDRYGGLLNIGFGAEIGVQKESIEKAQNIANSHDFDFIIMSCHRIGGKSFRQQFFQQGKTQLEYNRGYYEALLDCARSFKKFNVIGHINLINRYDACGVLPFENVCDIVAEIFRVIIPEGNGIEVNTSSFRYGMSGFMPSVEMLELYRKMGGDVITIGSDAHSPEYVADHFDDALNLLRDTGFKYICTFKAQTPTWHLI